MKKNPYIGKSSSELIKILTEKRIALRKLRFGTPGSRARNVKEISATRKDIARIMTELNKVKQETRKI